MSTAQRMIDCSKCVQEVGSFKQNVLLSISLLASIASGFDKLLRAIDLAASNASASGIKLPLTFVDRSRANSHRHTYAEDCPVMFELEVDGDEWKRLTRRIVAREVYEDRNAAHRTLQGLVSAAEFRQDVWHQSINCVHDNREHAPPGALADCAILRLAKDVRRQIAVLPT